VRLNVALIHELRGQGQSYRAIAATLTEQGVPTAQGASKWAAQTVRTVVLRSAA
jgi:hypothetical protein